MNLLTLVDNDNNLSLWSITVPNGEFGTGFLFGAYYGLTKLGRQNHYRFSPSPYDKDWTINDTAMGLVQPMTYEQLMTYYNNMPADIKFFTTVIIVRSPINPQLMYMMYIPGSAAAYLRGMFTALQAFNIPIAEVLLAKPMLHKTYFDIEGLLLPRIPL